MVRGTSIHLFAEQHTGHYGLTLSRRAASHYGLTLPRLAPWKGRVWEVRRGFFNTLLGAGSSALRVLIRIQSKFFVVQEFFAHRWG